MFADLVRAHRRRLGLTQEELAERTGLSVRSISKLESGRTSSPRAATVRLLAEAFGLTGAQQQELRQAASGGELPRAAASPAPAGAAVSTPAQLPPGVSMFTGRAAELAELDGLLLAPPPPESARAREVAIAVLSGMAGAGKTALAVHWAHRVAGEFPDGQLYVDLGDGSPEAALAPVEVLARFLRALGTPGEQVPTGIEEATGRYRSLLAGRRVLVVLDNAAGVEQVRPLLPAAPGCLALVTSRYRLAGLVARDGARWLGVDTLPPAEAHALLGRVLAAGRAAPEPAIVAELARCCGYLPLALRIAAANLTTRPEVPIEDYLRQLRDQGGLAALSVDGDPQTAVVAAFDLSYRRLPAPAQRMFRRLGLLPGGGFGAEGAAALADLPVAPAGELLASLAQAQLLQEPAAGRYRLHDLLRAYAAERAAQEEPDQQRRAARERLFAWYLRAARAAADVLYPEQVQLADGPAAADAGPSPGWAGDPAGALAWLDAEHENLVSAIGYAAGNGPRPVAWRLVQLLGGYWRRRSYLLDYRNAAAAAVVAARSAGDRRGEAAMRLALGTVHQMQGLHGDGLAHYRAAAALAGQAGWAEGQAAALGNTSGVHLLLGRLDRALADLTEALELFRSLGRRGAVANALSNLGTIHYEQGQLARAAQSSTEALKLYRELGVPPGVDIPPLLNLGGVTRELGRPTEAREHLTQALTMCRELGHRAGEVDALCDLAKVMRDTGECGEARATAQAAAQLAVELGLRHPEATARNTLGAVWRCLGHPQRAVVEHRRALELARGGGYPDAEISALLGLASVHSSARADEEPVADAARARELARERGYRLREGKALTVLTELHLHDPAQAATYAQQALEVHEQTGYRLGQARTHLLLGHLRQRAGDRADAVAHWQRAKALFADIGSPEVESASALLAGREIRSW